MARFQRSAQRLSLPGFDAGELLACIRALVRVEKDWVPNAPGYSLYLRPTLMGTTPFLGVGRALDATLFVLCSPCGPYMASGVTAVSLFLEEQVVRAAPGGVGSFKVGGNYATTIAPAVAAQRSHGCVQVLYTYKPDGAVEMERTVSEAGAMNVFFLLEGRYGAGRELVTPPLDGTILPGVTRQSVLELCRERSEAEGGLLVSERPLGVAELVEAGREGRLLEMFCTGTAAVVMPVQSLVRADGEEVQAAAFEGGAGHMLSTRVAGWLAQIQRGGVPGHPWSVAVGLEETEMQC